MITPSSSIRETPIETAVVLPLRGPVLTDAGEFDAQELFERWQVGKGQSNPGMPMHITLMASFLDIADLDDHALGSLATCLAPWRAFELDVTEVRQFEGPPRRAWLAPEPADVFVSMTDSIMQAFPGLLPYGGEHAGIVPHVSVAKEQDAVSFEAAIKRVEVDLPFRTWMRSVEIYSLGTDGWELETSWNLEA